ncbi:single-stranded DNA-binding protein [uncultured Mitsuokella sp.]|nr:single-stranded DNA-binding protein [uncultured Mitsuokella sp.]
MTQGDYGRLTADPELQTASNGNEFVRFTLAVDRHISKKTREEHIFYN